MKFEKSDESTIVVTMTGTREEVQRLLDALTARKRSAEERSAVAELVAGLSKALGVKTSGKTIADVLKAQNVQPRSSAFQRGEPMPVERPDDLPVVPQPGTSRAS